MKKEKEGGRGRKEREGKGSRKGETGLSLSIRHGRLNQKWRRRWEESDTAVYCSSQVRIEWELFEVKCMDVIFCR